jgi:hypothetical protein
VCSAVVIKICGPIQSSSSVQCPEGFSAMASRLLSTPTKSTNTRGPVISDPQPKLRQLSLRDCLHPGTHDTPEKPKRNYKTRGTCGTFAGNRPPKRQHLMATFEEKRNAHQAELQEKKSMKSKPIKDRNYQQFMKRMLPLETSGSTRDRFRSGVQKWKSQTTSGQDAAIAMSAENMAVM